VAFVILDWQKKEQIVLKNIEKLKKMAFAKGDENYRFMNYLKGINPSKLDSLFVELSEKYLTEDFCLSCANCCRSLDPRFSKGEIRSLVNELEISMSEFMNKYVDLEKSDGYILKTNSCPFLHENKCQIYTNRPHPCRSYPHLDKKIMAHRLIEVIDNSSVCPVVYQVLEDLKEEFNWKDENET